MERILCLAVGYLFGLFQTGYIYSKLHHVDIRKEGSGNAGSTNVLRVMGVKAGATVFLGDFFKTLIPCILVRHFFQNQPEMVNLLVLYTAFGVILGHNYPFYMGFKGGKGIAATAGLLVAMDLRVTAVCLIAFILIVAVTRYVSLGSLAVVIIYLIEVVVYGQMGGFGVKPPYLYEMYGIAAFLMLSAFYKHKANIVRLMNGTENKISIGKK